MAQFRQGWKLWPLPLEDGSPKERLHMIGAVIVAYKDVASMNVAKMVRGVKWYGLAGHGKLMILCVSRIVSQNELKTKNIRLRMHLTLMLQDLKWECN